MSLTKAVRCISWSLNRQIVGQDSGCEATAPRRGQQIQVWDQLTEAFVCEEFSWTHYNRRYNWSHARKIDFKFPFPRSRDLGRSRPWKCTSNFSYCATARDFLLTPWGLSCTKFQLISSPSPKRYRKKITVFFIFNHPDYWTITRCRCRSILHILRVSLVKVSSIFVHWAPRTKHLKFVAFKWSGKRQVRACLGVFEPDVFLTSTH